MAASLGNFYRLDFAAAQALVGPQFGVPADPRHTANKRHGEAASLALTVLRHLPGLIKQIRLLAGQIRAA